MLTWENHIDFEAIFAYSYGDWMYISSCPDIFSCYSQHRGGPATHKRGPKKKEARFHVCVTSLFCSVHGNYTLLEKFHVNVI